MFQFHFKNFDPEEKLRIQADEILNRLLDQAPYDASAAAVIELEGSSYRCSIDLYTKAGPFIASSAHPTAIGALKQAEHAIARKLAIWRDRRFQAIPPGKRDAIVGSVA